LQQIGREIEMQPPIPYRLGTFSSSDGSPYPAIVVQDRALALADAQAILPAGVEGVRGHDSMLSILDEWQHNLPILQAIADQTGSDLGWARGSKSVSVDSLTFLPPVNRPRQVFCSGANYKKHVVDIIVAQTMSETAHMSPDERRAWGTQKMDARVAHGTPFFFCKPQSTITGPFDSIILPFDARQPDWELELGVVIGKRARRVSRAEALDYVAGYVVVNDITTRDRVNRREGDMREMGMDWVASKGSPTYLPMGPYLVPASLVGSPQSLQVTLKVNGETMQNEGTEDMIFDVARLIEALSATCELLPGDLICTGSPAGNGMHYGRFLRHGDVVEGSITGLGTQRNVCVAEATQ
jgi:2,4-didehydro-3-deoxy-L-rhamnonate hydrolase